MALLAVVASVTLATPAMAAHRPATVEASITGSVTGSFYDGIGNLLPGTVSLYQLDGTLVQSEYTDTGYWAFQNVEQGSYTLRAYRNLPSADPDVPNSVWFERENTIQSATPIVVSAGRSPYLFINLSSAERSHNQGYVTSLYQDYLGRFPSADETNGWVDRLTQGAPRGAISAGFVNSDEYRLIRIDNAYQSILGRGADGSGRADWLHWMQQGRLTPDDIETSFYASQEYFLQHGGTNPSFTRSLYRHCCIVRQTRPIRTSGRSSPRRTVETGSFRDSGIQRRPSVSG
ncbi:DUF4214 domain-containing protein [Subtercola frigoramans]|uniref:DUF4214 domain-containing protein n=1 Tax=Subtercola frigoramans TaxID=120298 RepID=A0ABS2L6X4_9MICO|nr:DUF4214 domain-containing protein [Subtercola frigoramans]MBM7472856.1 hypothetical protein [Subtercola frigoramans]